jgi:hypothetical protein
MDNIFALSNLVKDENSNKLNNLKEVGYGFEFFLENLFILIKLIYFGKNKKDLAKKLRHSY